MSWHAVGLGFSTSSNPVGAISASRAARKGTTLGRLFFPATFVILLAVIRLDGEALFLGGNVYTKQH